jgi:predicted metalloprotease
MRLDDLRPSDNVDDRRGQGGGGGGFGPRMAVGGGGFGVIVIILIALFLGVDPSQLLGGGGGPVSPVQQTQPSSGPRSDDASFLFARKIVGSNEDIWTAELSRRGVQFSPAILTTYDSATPTACGQGQSSAGPFYCPGDQRIYLDLSFFNELANRFGAPGDFAQAYVIAHEYGHHIQNLLGTMQRQRGNLSGPQSKGATGASVRLELQADCYAGVWANKAQARFNILQTGDVEEGLRAASAVGDDTLEKQAQGYVVPDSFTHGSSAQRVRWFQRGFQTGDIDQCDTFNAPTL